MLLIVLLGYFLNADNPNLLLAEQFLRRGMFVYALQKVEEHIEQEPLEEDGYVFRGLLMSIRGQYQSSIVDYYSGLGSERLWGTDSEGFANSLRVLGKCKEASKIRNELRRVGKVKVNTQIRFYVDQITDLRYCGMTDQAWAIQEQLEAHFPNASLTHTSAADLFLDEGNLDSAEYHIWVSELYFKNSATVLLKGRLALLEGRYEDAVQYLEFIQSKRVSDRDKSIQLMAMFLNKQPQQIVYETSSYRWRYNENPVIAYLRVLALEELQWADLLQDEQEWFSLLCDQSCLGYVKRTIAIEAGSVVSAD
jgi:tetratricopeptide (TPR) repeat protein